MLYEHQDLDLYVLGRESGTIGLTDRLSPILTTRQWVVRGCLQRRLESKLYLFNCFGMLLPYAVAVVLNFVWSVRQYRVID